MLNRVSFSLRVTLFSIVLVTITAGISAFLAYQESRRVLEQSVVAELLAVVNSTAPLIDGDLHHMIYLNDEEVVENEEEFEFLRDQLDSIKQSNQLSDAGSPLYTLRKAYDYDTTQELEFVVMTDPGEHGEFFVGNRYKAQPHLIKALAGASSSTGIYEDSEGWWISAAAPIYNSEKQIVGVLQADRTVNYFKSEAQILARKILLGAGITILIASLLGMLFSRTIVNPIRQLIEVTNRLGEGNLHERVLFERKDEIGQLGRSLNEMAEELLSHNEQLIEERKKAELASKAKSEFLANMSHEIRTPINGMISLSELLLSTELDEEQQIDVTTIQGCARSLTRIINDILDFSKIEAGKLEMVESKFSPQEILDQLIRELSGMLSDKNQELILKIEENVPTYLLGDALRLQQVIRNIVANSIKFTPQHGVIAIHISADSVSNQTTRLEIAIIDTGIGIDESKQEEVFNAFSQAEDATTKKYGGTGLGLAICVRLIEKMGGSIHVRSRPGLGTCFYLTAQFSLPEVELQPTSVYVVDSIQHTQETEKQNPNELELSKNTAEILVVEDNPVNKNTIQRILTARGFLVTVASDGIEALKTLEKNSFDLILMDLHMPKMGGIETTQKIRTENPEHAKTPILALTAHAISGVRAECFEAGMNGYVSKPIDFDLLQNEIESLLYDSSQE